MSLLRGFWVAPLIAGALLASAFAPLDLGTSAASLGFAVLFLSMRLRGGERAGRQALVFGMIWFIAGLAWIRMTVSAGWVFVAFWCAMHEAIFARCLRPSFRRARDRGDASWVLTAPLLHLGADMVRTVLLTGFPWLLPGYAGWQNPALLGSADLIGVHGSTLAIVALGAALAEVAARRIEGKTVGVRPLVPAAAVWALLAGWSIVKPAVETRDGPVFAILQPSIPQELKEGARQPDYAAMRAEMWSAHETLARESLAAGHADVVVWGETMVPADAHIPVVAGRPLDCVTANEAERRWEIDARPRARLVAAAGGRATLAGITSFDERRWRTRNSSVLLDPAGVVLGCQDKQHLCPGGETLLVFDWLPGPLRDSLSASLEASVGFVPNLEAGEGTVLLELPRKERPAVRIGALICYESVFPSLVRGMVTGGADVLVNLSNYGWFYGTAEMDQALAMAVFRAAELRRPLVLASNNGISAAIGPDGRIGVRTKADERTYVHAPVLLATGSTPFAAMGEWPAWCLGALGAAAAVLARRKSAREASETS